MRRAFHIAIAGLMLASLMLFTTRIAAAAQQWEIDISPIYFIDGTGDSSAPLPPGTFPLYCGSGPACSGTPRTTNDWKIDYGLTYHINKKWTFAYAHTNFDFSLGRIVTIAPFSLLTGDITDREDKLSLNYALGHGLALSGDYDSHQRTSVAGLCLNQEDCGGASNPSSINSNSWGLGATYATGPHHPYQPPMFSFAFNANYFPRPSAGNCQDYPAVPSQPACFTGGIPGYVGSGVVYGYGVTMFPFADTDIRPGTIPFVGYSSLPVWFHAENTPEVYNVTDFGLLQILPHDLSASFTYFKLQGRYSSDTIPPPDVVRSVTFLFKLSYALKF